MAGEAVTTLGYIERTCVFGPSLAGRVEATLLGVGFVVLVVLIALLTVRLMRRSR